MLSEFLLISARNFRDIVSKYKDRSYILEWSQVAVDYSLINRLHSSTLLTASIDQ